MVRTRIREDQEQDVSFVSESELNEFFTSVVITGTEDATGVIQNFKTFFPGQGLIVVTDGLTVTTGTQLVTISGFRNEFVASSGSLQSQIQQAGGVTSITASGITVSGALTFAGIQGITLIPNASTNTITFSGSGVTSIITVSGIEGDITIVGAGEVDVITEGNTIVISGTPHTPFPNAIVGVGQVVVISGANTTTISGTPHTPVPNAIIGTGTVVVTSGIDTTTISGTPHVPAPNAIIGGANVTVTSGSNTTTISSVNNVSNALQGTRGIVVNSGTSITTLDFVPTALVGIQGNTVTSGTNTITIGHVPKALVSDNFASVISGTNVDTIVHKAITGSNGNVVITGTNSVNIGHVPKALVSDNFATITSGTNTDTIQHKAIVGDNFVSVVTGTNSVRLVSDAIVAGTAVTVTSGTNTVSISVTGATQSNSLPRTFAAADETVSTTTSTTFQLKLNLAADTAVIATGTSPEPYRLQWYYEWGQSSASTEFVSQVQIDDVSTVHEQQWRPTATSSSDFAATAGFIDMTLSSGSHSFDLDYKSNSAGKTSRIRRARLNISALTLGPGSTTPPQLGT